VTFRTLSSRNFLVWSTCVRGVTEPQGPD